MIFVEKDVSFKKLLGIKVNAIMNRKLLETSVLKLNLTSNVVQFS